MINTLKSASTDIQSKGLIMEKVFKENPIQRPNDGWLKTSKICIHRKIQSSGLTDDGQQIWKKFIHRKFNPALTMDDDKQIWKSTSTEKSNPTSSPRKMTSKSEKSTTTENQSNGLNWMSTYIIAGSVCHATCHVPVRYCARGFSRLADSTCRKVYGSEDAVDLVSFELRRSKFFTFCRSLDRLLPCCCCYKSDRNPSKIEACALQNHSPQREIRNCIFERAMRISMLIIICGESCCD
jgi:hypothetical protein